MTKYKWYWLPLSEKWRWFAILFWSVCLVFTIAKIPEEGISGITWSILLTAWIFEYLFRPGYDER